MRLDMTTANRRMRSTNHTRRAERFLDGPLEERLKDYLNGPDSTMTTLAEALGVQKATVNYWMMRLGIIYGRVAHYYDEEVRVLSRSEAELVDAIHEKGLELEDVENWERSEARLANDLVEKGISIDEVRSLTESDTALLRALKRRGISETDLEGMDASLFEAVRELENKGIDIDDILDISHADLRTLKRMREQDIAERDLRD